MPLGHLGELCRVVPEADTAKYQFKLLPQPEGSPFICLIGPSPPGDALHGEDYLSLKVIENQ